MADKLDALDIQARALTDLQAHRRTHMGEVLALRQQLSKAWAANALLLRQLRAVDGSAGELAEYIAEAIAKAERFEAIAKRAALAFGFEALDGAP